MNPVRVIFYEDNSACKALLPYAQAQLGVLRNLMSFQSLKQLSRTSYLPDGSKIFCQSVFGQDTIHIFPAIPRRAEELPEATQIQSSAYLVIGLLPDPAGEVRQYLFDPFGLKFYSIGDEIQTESGNTVISEAFSVPYSKEVGSIASGGQPSSIDRRFYTSVLNPTNGLIWIARYEYGELYTPHAQDAQWTEVTLTGQAAISSETDTLAIPMNIPPNSLLRSVRIVVDNTLIGSDSFTCLFTGGYDLDVQSGLSCIEGTEFSVDYGYIGNSHFTGPTGPTDVAINAKDGTKFTAGKVSVTVSYWPGQLTAAPYAAYIADGKAHFSDIHAFTNSADSRGHKVNWSAYTNMALYDGANTIGSRFLVSRIEANATRRVYQDDPNAQPDHGRIHYYRFDGGNLVIDGDGIVTHLASTQIFANWDYRFLRFSPYVLDVDAREFTEVKEGDSDGIALSTHSTRCLIHRPI